MSKMQLNVQTVQLEEGNIASFLIPSYALTGRKLAVVDEEVLNRLKALLQSANIGDIMAMFQLKMSKVRSITDWTLLLTNELAFHKTVNLLDNYFDPNVEVIAEKPFNVKYEPTFDELMEQKERFRVRMEELDAQIKSHPDYKEEAVASINLSK